MITLSRVSQKNVKNDSGQWGRLLQNEQLISLKQDSKCKEYFNFIVVRSLTPVRPCGLKTGLAGAFSRNSHARIENQADAENIICKGWHQGVLKS
jgi:hypothetical protein